MCAHGWSQPARPGQRCTNIRAADQPRGQENQASSARRQVLPKTVPSLNGFSGRPGYLAELLRRTNVCTVVTVRQADGFATRHGRLSRGVCLAPAPVTFAVGVCKVESRK